MFGRKKFKIRKLEVDDAKSAAMLYAYTARYDKYFTEVFGSDSCEIEILKKFSPDVMNAIKYGNCFGAFDKDKLVGLVLAFNLIDWRNNHREEYNHVFDSSDDFMKAVTEYFKQQHTDVTYVFAVCVEEQYRCQGIASSLIKNLCNLYDKDFTIVSDATHPQAMPMWLKNGFREEVCNDVHFVIK